MTEPEWLANTDANRMLEFLRGRVGERKLRLFAVSCCRRIWPLLSDERSRHAVTTADGFADGQIDRKELLAARRRAERAWESVRAARRGHPGLYYWGDAAAEAAAAATAGSPFPPSVLMLLARRADYFVTAAGSAANAAAAHRIWLVVEERGGGRASLEEGEAEALWDETLAAEWAWQAGVIRDIFGNPFRPAPSSSSWRTSSALALARSMYDSRDFTPMPVFADALEEAGCDDADVLSHCREQGTHVRGCWVVDLVLGKT